MNATSTRGRVACLGILVSAIITIKVPGFVAFLPEGRGWLLAREAMMCALMTGLPLLLAQMAPEAAGFDRQWLPSARSHWGWFLVMLFVLILGGVIATRFSNFTWFSYSLTHKSSLPHRLISPAAVVVGGVIMVLFYPIAEEIFWRAYLLDQLRKLTRSSAALVIQSVLFAMSHLWLYRQGILCLLPIFWFGIIFGIWRIRFRSILPLMLAHIIVNAIALGPVLKIQYDYEANLWSKPHARQIDSLTKEPIQTAVPAIIAFLAAPDEDVRNYATLVLTTHYREKAQPYLKDALTSTDTEIVNGALFVIEMARLSDLAEEVRKVVWSSDDRSCQMAAVLTLENLGDVKGLQEIAQRHPDENVRRVASRAIGSP